MTGKMIKIEKKFNRKTKFYTYSTSIVFAQKYEITEETLQQTLYNTEKQIGKMMLKTLKEHIENAIKSSQFQNFEIIEVIKTDTPI